MNLIELVIVMNDGTHSARRHTMAFNPDNIAYIEKSKYSEKKSMMKLKSGAYVSVAHPYDHLLLALRSERAIDGRKNTTAG